MSRTSTAPASSSPSGQARPSASGARPSSTAAELHAYCGGRTSGPLLVGRTGQHLSRNVAYAGFRRVVATCGLAPQQGAGPSSLHAFRHTLAVDALIDAHRRGLDIDTRIAVLSTFLGHKDPLNTYWYLTASPQLVSAVSDRMAAALRRRTP